MIKISVIIPAYNADKTIAQNLEAILRQKGLKEKPEVIVVDDGSTDSTESIVKSYPEVIIVKQNNAGPATARNTGAKLAKGGILVFTDSDTVPHENWLKELTAPFDNEKIYATTGTYSIENPQSPLAVLIQSEIEAKHKKYGEFVAFAGSYNFAIRKNIFIKIGKFNTRYIMAEDLEFCYRMASLNYNIKYVPKAIVGHYHPESIFKYLKKQYEHGFWRSIVIINYPNRLTGDNYSGKKEIIESLLAFALLLSPLFLFLNIFIRKKHHHKHNLEIFKILYLMPIFSLLALEFYYEMKLYSKSNNKYQINISSRAYATLVFSLRAVCRILGFIKGIVVSNGISHIDKVFNLITIPCIRYQIKFNIKRFSI